MKFIQLGIIILFCTIIIVCGCSQPGDKSATNSIGGSETAPRSKSAERTMGDSLTTDGNNDIGPADTLTKTGSYGN